MCLSSCESSEHDIEVDPHDCRRHHRYSKRVQFIIKCTLQQYSSFNQSGRLPGSVARSERAARSAPVVALVPMAMALVGIAVLLLPSSARVTTPTSARSAAPLPFPVSPSPVSPPPDGDGDGDASLPYSSGGQGRDDGVVSQTSDNGGLRGTFVRGEHPRQSAARHGRMLHLANLVPTDTNCTCISKCWQCGFFDGAQCPWGRSWCYTQGDFGYALVGHPGGCGITGQIAQIWWWDLCIELPARAFEPQGVLERLVYPSAHDLMNSGDMEYYALAASLPYCLSGMATNPTGCRSALLASEPEHHILTVRDWSCGACVRINPNVTSAVSGCAYFVDLAMVAYYDPAKHTVVLAFQGTNSFANSWWANVDLAVGYPWAHLGSSWGQLGCTMGSTKHSKSCKARSTMRLSRFTRRHCSFTTSQPLLLLSVTHWVGQLLLLQPLILQACGTWELQHTLPTAHQHVMVCYRVRMPCPTLPTAHGAGVRGISIAHMQ